ncbi:MAG: family 10 glycosylhydrolase [bacterium]
MKWLNPTALRTTGLLLFLTLAGACGASWFDGDSGKIVVVQGTSSLIDPSEKGQAARLATHIDTWLTEAGAPHKVLTDEQVSSWRLWRTRVVILPYNPHPSPFELKAFQEVIHAGGILVVCYGMDASLASLMEVRLGPFQQARTNTQWASFEFDRTSLPGLPSRVFQSSQHLIPAFPASGTAHVIATWLDSRGTRTPEAAWIRSKAGFWMSHTLQPGDDEAKRQMLLAMLATVMPDIWTQAAEYCLSLRRPFGEYESLKAACRTLGRPLPPRLSRGQDGEAYTAAQAWLSDLTQLYARSHLTNAFSLRGIWLDEGAVQSADMWPMIEASLMRQKLNTIFIHVGNPLTLSPPISPHASSRQSGSPLPEKAKLALHAWLSCMNLEGTPPDQLKTLRSQNRLQVSDTGEPLDWLCPSHPENRSLLAGVASRLAQDPTFAGVHLDYIRYMNSHSCYCPGCHQRFEQSLGRPVLQWPEDVRSGALTPVWQTWRAAQISACVDLMSQAIHDTNPDLQVSAAVYGATPACFASVGQDWPLWLRRNAVNFVCPMNYTSDLHAFQALLKTQGALGLTSRIYPGVGLTSSQSRLSPDQVTVQLIQVQNAGFPGFVLFEYNPRMTTDPLPYLQSMEGAALSAPVLTEKNPPFSNNK